MDGNHGPEDKLRSVIAMCGRALEEFTLPESNAGLIEAWRRLEELNSALATVRTRLEVAVVLNRAPEIYVRCRDVPNGLRSGRPASVGRQ